MEMSIGDYKGPCVKEKWMQISSKIVYSTQNRKDSWLSVRLSIYLCICLSACLSMYFCVCMYISAFIYLSIDLSFVYVSTYLFVYVCVCVCVCMDVSM
jgi:hypothetical protein